MIASPESFEHAKELLAEGKRDLLVHAIPDAVTNCSKACEIMVKQKGEMAAECAEAYFYYGKALLELSRVESGVLGNALDGVDMETKTADDKDALVEDTEAMTTDERSEIEEKVADALEENFEKHDFVARAHTGDDTEDETEDDEVMEGEDKVGDEMETEDDEVMEGEDKVGDRGTPVALIPVIVIIETVSNIIRPGTLSIRLAANIVAGHLLLTLLGSQGPSRRGVVILGLMVSLILLLCLELAVACIQAYVFTILRSLYLNELRTVSFNKNMV